MLVFVLARNGDVCRGCLWFISKSESLPTLIYLVSPPTEIPLTSNVIILAIFASVSATSLPPAVISSAADISSVECMCSTSTLPNEPVEVAEPLIVPLNSKPCVNAPLISAASCADPLISVFSNSVSAVCNLSDKLLDTVSKAPLICVAI